MDIVKKINNCIVMFLMALILMVNPFFVYMVNAATNEYDYYTYYTTTADILTLGWNNPAENYNPETDFCVINLYNYERKMATFVIETQETTTPFRCPKTGHWIIQAHMKRDTVDENGQPVQLVSETVTSITSGVVNDVPRGWWVFAWIAGTGPIDISKKIEIIGETING
jgi:hypothetical protein